MSRRMLNRLSAPQVKTISEPGRYADGGGLYLLVRPGGSRSWIFIYIRAGKRREMGLGSARDLPLAEARKKAALYREMLAMGDDPMALKRQQTAKPDFGAVADQYLAEMQPQWTNKAHITQWRRTVEVEVKPIRLLRVDQVGTEDVLTVLKPLWVDKAETGRRCRQRIEKILDYAKARGWRDETLPNPARWKGHLDQLLPKLGKASQKHHAALPFAQLPHFWRDLASHEGNAARALQFLILTAARTSEVLLATWSELDLEAGLWVLPAERMKAGREHRIPLTEPALEVLDVMQPQQLGETETSYVFPGQRRGKPLSNMAMANVLKRMQVPVTVHGFRSTFRDWAGETTSFPRDVCEMALAHSVQNKAEAAYRRGDMLDKRRKLMEAWARYCTSEINLIDFARMKNETGRGA